MIRSNHSLLLLFAATLLGINSCKEFSQNGAGEVSDEINPELQKISPQAFREPPVRARAMVYWDWIDGNINREAITRDLEHMKEVGLGGGLLFDVPFLHLHSPEWRRRGLVAFMSDEWLDLVNFAAEESHRLGLDFGIVLCGAWNTGGPWIKPQDGNQINASSVYYVTGPQDEPFRLPRPSADTNYRDIAVLAWPTPANQGSLMLEHQPQILINGKVADAGMTHRMIDGNPNNAVSIPAPAESSPTVVEFIFPRQVTADYLYIRENPYWGIKSGYLEADEGDSWQTLTRFETNGYLPVIKSFQSVSSDHFRLVFTGAQAVAARTGDMRLYEVNLIAPGTWPAVVPPFRNWSLKRLNIPAPGRREDSLNIMAYFNREIQVPDRIRDINPGQVVELTSQLRPDGVLNWDVPEGKWTILRFGMLPSYSHVYQADKREGNEGALESDKMSAEATRLHYENMAGAILDHLSPEGLEALDFFHVDSWEQEQNLWTGTFPEEFIKRRGYDITPYLPVLEGQIVGDAETTDRVLWDYRRTIGDLHINNHFEELADLCHADGIRLSAQAGHYFQAHMDAVASISRADYPSGEFWNHGRNSPVHDIRNSVKDAASAANIYNRDYTLIESFTTNGWFANWVSPLDLKKLGDYAYTEGVRRMYIHGLWMDPDIHAKPLNFSWGSTGIHVGPSITWMPDGRSFFDYLARCQYLIERGVVDNDVLYFYGDGFPNISPLRSQLPVILASGRDYDVTDARAIHELIEVKDNKLVLPHGASYRLLLLPPQETMLPETLEAVYRLVKDGALVLGPKPLRSPSLAGQPEADETILKLADELWGENPDRSGSKRTGKGRVYWGMEPEEVFTAENIPPQVEVKGAGETGIRHKYRHIPGKQEFYFLINHSEVPVETEVLFRTTGKHLYCWKPDNGEIIRLNDFSEENGRSRVKVQLAPWGSTFVVFDPEKGGKQVPGSKPEEDTGRLAEVIRMKGPWEVSFEVDRGAPPVAVFDELMSWTRSEDPGIRYFSGYGTYKKQFELTRDITEGEKVFLDLGQVGDVAHVKVNGQDLGTLWKPPFRIDITDAMSEGENRMEIAVVNTWMNRLVGDEQFPLDQAIVNTLVRGQIPESEFDLKKFPSGLFGPVTVRFYK